MYSSRNGYIESRATKKRVKEAEMLITVTKQQGSLLATTTQR
jgi:hypothetical protein